MTFCQLGSIIKIQQTRHVCACVTQLSPSPGLLLHPCSHRTLTGPLRSQRGRQLGRAGKEGTASPLHYYLSPMASGVYLRQGGAGWGLVVKPRGEEPEALLSACLNLSYDSTNSKLCDFGKVTCLLCVSTSF